MNNQLTLTRVYSLGCEWVGKGIVESKQLFLIQQERMEVGV